MHAPCQGRKRSIEQDLASGQNESSTVGMFGFVQEYGIMKTLVLALVGFYKQAISPAVPSSCKFYPTCSAYAAEAVEKYGWALGLRLATRRLLRCRPFHAGGYDPVD